MSRKRVAAAPAVATATTPLLRAMVTHTYTHRHAVSTQRRLALGGDDSGTDSRASRSSLITRRSHSSDGAGGTSVPSRALWEARCWSFPLPVCKVSSVGNTTECNNHHLCLSISSPNSIAGGDNAIPSPLLPSCAAPSTQSVDAVGPILLCRNSLSINTSICSSCPAYAAKTRI